MKLSPHFTLQELTNSATATKQALDNTPTLKEVERLQILCIFLLEPLRKHTGKPVRITSGFRCKALNKAVGGVADSYHVKGMAADIEVSNEKTAESWARFLNTLFYCDQVIYERRGKTQWLHIGWSYAPRHQFLKIIK